MNRKEILTIILLICVIFSLQAVVAADSGFNSTDGTVLSVDENVSSYALPSSESDTLAEVANAESFTNLSNQLSGASEVTLTKNYTYKDTDSFSSGITIDHNIVIDGQGKVIIDANNKSRIFFIASGVTNVTLKGITFINGNATAANGIAGFGGSIFAKGVVHIDNCKFIDNTANYANGGAVTICGFGSTITNSYFEGNRAINKPGTDTTGGAGAVFLNASNVTIKHSQFISNWAGLNGGAVGSSDKSIENCTITNCTFTSNTANGSAGAVGMQSRNFRMYNSTFKYNEAKGMFTTYPGNGGALVMRGWDSYAYNCTFINNTAKQHGGAAFSTNTTYNPSNNNTSFKLCTFINNTAGVNGGAITWAKGATYGYIENCIFTNNTAKRSGGAVYWYGTDGIIKHSNFTYNSALGIVDAPDSYGTNTTGGNGGAIMWVGSDGEVYNCTFRDNNASVHGGAVYLQGSSEGLCNNTKFDTCNFISNIAGVNGGAIDWYRGARNGHILNSVFEDNIANRSGGAIFWSGIGGEIRNSNFTNNKALGIKEANDTYGNMTYGGYGGAVMWTGPNGTVDYCRFISNEAKYNDATQSGGRGGAVYLQGSVTDNCTHTIFSNCNFTSNIAGTNGGAIDWHEGAHDGKVINSTFNHNIANSNGGAIYWRGHDGNIISSNFTNNTANATRPGHYGNIGDGGAIFWAGINGTVDNCRFIDNEAKKNADYVNGGRGGAVYLEKCSHGNKNTTFHNVYFENNIAGTNGGAIDWHEGAEDGLVDNGIFINNTAYRNGGAIFWNGHNGTIKNSRFINNRATGEHREYDFDINMSAGDVIVVTALPDVSGVDIHKLYVVNQTITKTTYSSEYYVITVNSTTGIYEWNQISESEATLQYSLNLPQNNVTVCTELPDNSSAELNRLYILNITTTNEINHFESWVAFINSTGGKEWKALDAINISESESVISPVDWAIDEYFGGDGGTLLWSGDYGLIYNCTFTDSNSARRGGAAYMTGGDYVTYELCNFTNCTSGTNGGGVDWLAGANYGKIYNCIFNNTRAARSAGAIYYDGWYGDMQNITIINTTSYGGTLKQSKDKLVNYAGWDSSHWDTNTTGGDAGAIMFTGSFINVYNVTFTNCTASGRGGAVFLQDNHNVTFDLCKFENNYAKGIANNTWANYTQERNESNNDTKVNYKLTGHGGAIAFDVNAKDCQIIDSKFYNNSARRNGGAVNFDEGSTNNNITSCEFINNTVYDDGGAINFDHGADLCGVYNSIFYNNTATGRFGSTSKGGTICLVGNNVTVENSTFTLGSVTANKTENAKDNETWGGAIFVTGNFTVIKNCTFENCTTVEDGGALYVIGDDCKLYNSTFTSNVAGDDGGAIYWTGANGLLYNITCKDNKVTGETLTSSNAKGGTICLTGNFSVVTKSKFEDSSAIVDGGAIYATGNYVNITESEFKNCIVNYINDKYHRGGAIYVLGNYSNVLDCKFEDSKAQLGGDIFIEGNNVTIDNATSTSAYAYSAGGSVFVQGDNATVSNSSISLSKATVSGGAMYIHGVNATIKNSEFISTEALGTNASTGGGAIFIDGHFASVEDCNFTDNVATSTSTSGKTTVGAYGGALYITGKNVNVTGSNFKNSKAALRGGAIYIDGDNTTIEGSNFTNTKSTVTGSFGGAIFVKGYNADIVESSFTSCSSKSDGGSVYIDGAFTEIINSTFLKSKSETHYGGSLYITGDNATIVGSNFTESTANAGGALYNNGKGSKVYNSSFIDNSVGNNNGGAIYWNGGSMDDLIEGCYFKNNRGWFGAGVYYAGSNADTAGTIRKSTFVYNVGNRGGAIGWAASNNALIEYCYFANNSAVKHGAGIYAGANTANDGAGSQFNIFNCTFENNKVTGGIGGAISMKVGGSKIIDCNFSNNVAAAGGDIVLKEGGVSNVIIDGCNFANSRATSTGASEQGHGGGAISAWGMDTWEAKYPTKNITVSNSNFTNCTSLIHNGGAISWTSADGLIENCTFINCSAPEGGSIGIANTGTDLNNIKIINSSSTNYGGAIYIGIITATGNNHNLKYYPKDFDLNNVTIINGTSGIGGAIYIDSNAQNINLLNVLISNSSASNGGGVYVEGNNIKILDSNFTNNNATENGGAIYTAGSPTNAVVVNNTLFTFNHADLSGGAIYSAQEGSLFSYCNFTNNTALDGGAIAIVAHNQKVAYSNFTSNYASRNGGAIFVEKVANINITDSTFKQNRAKYDGGAIYNNDNFGASVYINNDIFIKNIADHNGGAILYVVYDTDNNPIYYRDYNKFDGIGSIDSLTMRTDVNMTDGITPVHSVIKSYFEDNEDYDFDVNVYSSQSELYTVVYIYNPTNVDRKSLNITVKLFNKTNGDLISTIVVNDSNFEDNFNEYGNYFEIDLDVVRNQTYDISIKFEDDDYLLKEFNGTFKTASQILGQFQTLQALINDAINIGNTSLSLNRSFHFTPEYDTGCMHITNAPSGFTIYGNGHVIDAQGFSRIFNITASNITFVNVVFENGNSSGSGEQNLYDRVDKGGAIFWAGKYGKLINCTFRDNYAEYGGGIYYNSTAENCTINGCKFNDNNATERGGAIDCNAPSMNLTDTTFTNNYADTGAALCREINATGGFGYNNTFISNHALTNGSALAWINASSIKIDKYTFINNTAGNSGGAIYVGKGSGNCKVLNSVFENNEVTNSTGGHGGAIEWYAEEGLVLNSNFTNNKAFTGGAIYVGSDSGKINITQSNFIENNAYGNGGAINLDASSVVINQSNFYNNTAVSGGAIYAGGKGLDNYVVLSTFDGNVATGGNGGAINWVASAGRLINSTFANNGAHYGGGVYMAGDSNNSQITNCTFDSNYAKYNGGAIDWNSTGGNLTHNLFIANHAQFGAALCRETNATGGFGVNNTFIGNHAYLAGAALGWMGSVGISITNYTFINNTADISGGAIYVSDSSHNCSIIDCIFENNYVTNKTDGWAQEFEWDADDGTHMYGKAIETDDPSLIGTLIFNDDTTVYYYSAENGDNAGTGGAISVLGSNTTIINTDFTNNHAKLGGAIYIGGDSGNTNVTNSIFTNNTAKERGGAINLHASAVNVNQSKFYNNTAINGSAIYVGGVGTSNSVYSSVFEGNNATGYGAGIYWRAYEGVIVDSNFTSNNAVYGGGIYLNGVSANTNITNTIFKLNNATKNGGAIECNASNIGIYNLTFDSNYAGEYGAALCREIGATGGHGINNTFIANHAGIAGAALAWLNVDNININYYYFYDNTADHSGGAIYISEGSDNCVINHSTFRGNNITNVTAGHGGAIDITGKNATIVNSNFTNNNAHYGGAVFAGNASGGTHITNVTFERNNAVNNGGAIEITGSGVTLNHTKFYSNVAGDNGGAIYVGGEGTSNVVWYTVFENNTARDHGGAINWLAYSGEVFYSNFTNNSAVYGGGIYLNHISSSSKIVNVIFKENKATKNGGAIDCNASYMGLNNTQFISNYAAEYGAALCREAGAEHGYGGNNTFISNYAGIAGAALAWLDVDGITINNYTFYNNSAQYSGGAIYVNKNSPNCNVSNSTFELNYVVDVLSGRGGVIDWLGANGTIYNSTFSLSYAVEAGALYIASDNMNIIKSNFSYAITLQRGGSILGNNANNATIADCIFDNSAAIGYITPEDKDFGQGGAIYWINSNNLTISNTKFYKTESHADGAVYLLNCNNSGLYNSLFNNSLSIRSGGSISWINSTNGTVDNCTVIQSEALYNGGAINLVGIDNVTVKNSKFDGTRASKANGGSIYVDGNVTLDNNTFTDYKAYVDWGASLYFHNGTSSVINSTFNGEDAIWVYKYATVNFTSNNVTGMYPNKDTHFLETEYDSKYNPVDYSLWNDGTVYLEDNNFDYVIFNNGTIKSQTYTYILDNETVNATWAENFTFWATIKDDNSNTIISVKSLNTTNDVYPYPKTPYYDLPYNAKSLNVTFQGIFHITGFDTGLEKNKVYDGTLNVLAPTKLDIGITQVNEGEKVTITARIAKNDVEFSENVTFMIDGKLYSRKVINDGNGGIATLELYNLSEKTYSVTAKYPGDINHFPCENSTFFVVKLRETWIRISVNNVVYGGYPVANITTNGNGTIMLSLNGESRRYNLTNASLLVNGSLIIPFDNLYNPGTHYINVIYIEDEYYKFATNDTSFQVFYQNNTIVATPHDITLGENEIIDITLNENATGYVKVKIGTQDYITPINQGVAQFNISGLAAGIYENIKVEYNGDVHVVGNSTNVTFTVNKKSSYVFDVKVDNITYGDNATVRVLLPTDATGNVTIYIDGNIVKNVTLVNGTATLNVVTPEGGEHIVNVTYKGDSKYFADYNNGTKFKVGPKSWKVNITEVDYRPYGETTTINITNIPKDLEGVNLTIKIDGVSYNVTINKTTGKATLKLNNLSGGIHDGFVIYSGDANYDKISQVFKPNIPKATPTIRLSNATGDVVATIDQNATGFIIFNLPTGEYPVQIVEGQATLTKDHFIIGMNGIMAFYDGDGNYTSAREKIRVYVDKYDTSLTVVASPTSVVVGDNATITVTVTGAENGKVIIEVNGYNYTVEFTNHIAELNVTLPAGVYTPKAYYLGDNSHHASNKTGNQFTVAYKITPTITITVPSVVKVGETIEIPVYSDGFNFTVWINGVKQTIKADGNISYYVSDSGIKTIFANTTENDDYYSANKTVVFEAIKTNPTLTIADLPSVIYVGDEITITVTSITDGVVTIKVDDVVINSDDVFTPALEGKYTITVVSAETEAYYAGSASKVFNVVKRNSQVNVTATGNSVGGNATITVQVQENATGYVTVNVNGTNYTIKLNSTGGGSVNITGLGNGTYNVHATYLGDNQYSTSENNTKTFEMTKIATTVDVSFNSPIIAGDDAIITVTMTPGINGTVKLTVGDKSYDVAVVNGAGIYSVTNLSNAVYNVQAVFAGDGKYEGSTSDIKQLVVNTIITNLVINIDEASINVGDNATVSVELRNQANAVIQINVVVTVKVNGANHTVGLVNGKGNFTLIGLANDTYTINAVFAGDDKYVTSTSNSLTLKVNKIATSIAVSVASPVTYGGVAEITITMDPSINDYVVLNVDGKNYTVALVNGVGKFNATGLNVGNYPINVTYAGDSRYSSSNNNTTSFDVVAADLDVSAIGLNVTVKEDVGIVIAVPGDFTGNVKVNVSDIYKYDDGAIPLISIGKFEAGTYTANVTFYGDNKYNEKSVLVRFNVTRVTPAINVTIDDTTYPNRAVAYVNVSDYANGTINITVDGKVFNATVTNGVATVNLDGLSGGVKVDLINFTATDKYHFNLTTTMKSVVKQKASTITIEQSGKDVIANVISGATGNVTFYINGVEYKDVQIGTDGKATVSNVLIIGNNTVVAVYDGDVNYTSSRNYTNFTVERNAALVNASATTVVYGNDSVITVKVPKAQTGYVRIVVNGTAINVTVEIVDGEAKFNASGLNVGRYLVNVTYLGDKLYSTNKNSTYFNVTKADLTAIAIGLNVTVEEDAGIVVKVPCDFDGKVKVNVSDIKYDDEPISLINLGKFEAGSYTANVTFYDSKNYNNRSILVKFNVTRVTPAINVTIHDVTYPNKAVATIDLGNGANGTVNVTIGTKVFEGTVTNGVASVDLTGLSAGNKEAKVEFFTNDGYNNNVTTYAKFTVYPNNSLVQFIYDKSVFKVGEGITFKIKTSNSTGNLTLYVNGEYYNKYSLTPNVAEEICISDNGEGTYTITAILAGNENYTGFDSSATFHVVKNDITISVNDTTDPSAIVVGTPVRFTANLNESVTGYVIFTINGANYVAYVSNSDIATYDYTPLDNSTITVVATFHGNDKYNRNASASNLFTVNRIPTEINLTVATPVTCGDVAVISVELNVTINATVKLSVDGKDYDVAIVDGKGGFNASGLSSGPHDVAVVFAGDDKYAGDDYSTTFTVDVSTLAADVNALNVTVEENTIFIINVTDDFKGNVSIKVGEDVLYNGTVKTLINASKLLAGDKTATVTFYGDSNYDKLILNNVKFTVSRAVPEITVTIDDETYPDKVIAVINVDNNANGTVNVTVGGKVFNGTVRNGVGSVELTNLSAGSKVAGVEFFTGDDYNDNATASVKFTVNKANSTIVIDVEKVYIYNDTIIINLTSTGSQGTINVTINGKVYPINNNKQITIENITADEYTIIANLAGNENYTAAVNSTTFKVKKAETDVSIGVNSVYKVGEDIIITLSTVNSTDLTVTINGKEYAVDQGKVTITGGLPNGTYIVSAVLAGNENYTESNDTKSFKVVKLPSELTISVTNITADQSETIKVNVTSGAKGQVIITVGGKDYYTTIEDEFATLILDNLTNDTYSVQVRYLGDEKYNESSGWATFKVNKLASSVKVEVANITLGDVATVNITVITNATGNVTIEIGSEYIQTVGVVDGKFSVIVPDLAAGNKTVKVTYNGDRVFSSSTDSANFTVGKASVEMNIVAGNVTYGENVPVTVFVNAEGEVTIKVNGNAVDTKAVENGKVEFEIPLSAGNYTIEAIYNGNDDFNSTSAKVNVTVAKANPTITVEAKDIAYGDVEYIIIKANVDGIVNVTVNGKTIPVELVNGETTKVVLRASRWDVPAVSTGATVEVPDLDVGNYPVEVKFLGNDNYNEFTATAEFDVVKANTTVDVQIEYTIKVGETQLLNITVDNENATGNVTISIDGVKYNATLANGKANFTTPKLSSGNHTVTVIYDGDGNLAGNWTQATFEVTKLEAPVSVEISNSTVGGKQTITVKVPSDATGQVLIDIGDKHYYANVTGGVATLELDDLPADDYDINVTYLGDENYTAKSVSDKFKVTKNNSTVNITAESITVGDNEVITFTVPEDATGNITVVIDGKTYTVPVSGGNGTLTVPNLAVGNYTIDVTYNGDDKYASSTNSTKFEVAKATVSPDDIKVVDLGNGTVVVVVPSDLTGDITVKVGDDTYNATIENGTATITMDKLTPGTYDVDVIYSGDDNHTNASTTAKVTTNKVQTPISVDLDNIHVGDKAIITVNVPENATGNVTIEIDGVKYTTDNITGGKAIFEIENLTNGTKTIAVEYAGDSNYVANHTTATISVSKVNPEVKMEISIDCDDVIIDVTAPSDATRPVLVDVDGVGYYVNITEGKGQLIIPGIAGGNHDVSARYLGDDKYGAASSDKSFNVSDVPSKASVKVDNITYGDKAIIEVSVPEDATGTVTVTIDGKPYSANVTGGKAIITVDGLEAGNYTVDATYSGDDKYASSSGSADLEVSKAVIDPDDIKVVDQGNGTVVVVVPSNATGNVTVKVGDDTYDATIKDGVAVVKLNDTTPGVHDIEVTYSGDDNYEGTSADSSVTVPKYDTQLDVTADDISIGDKSQITVKVPENATGNVTIEIDGKSYTQPIENGEVTFTIDNLTVGNKTATIKYAGDDNYNSNITTATFEVTKVTSEVIATIDDANVGENVTVKVVLPDDATGQVLIDIGGVGYYANVTDGIAYVEIPRIPSGEYDVAVTYTGDDKYSSVSNKTSFSMSKVDSFVIPNAANITQGENAVIVFTVPDDATGNITVTVNGVDYTLESGDVLSIADSKYTVAVSGGIGKLTIQGLPKGNYTVSVRFNGDDKYLPSTNTTKFNVAKAKADVDVDNKGNGSVAVVIPDDAGNVTVVVDGVNSTATVENGTVTVNLDNATPGKHNVSVIYTDNTGRDYVINSTVMVPKYETPITVDVSDSSVGEAVNVVVTVPDGVSGNITLEIDGKQYTAKVNSGKAVFDIVGLREGGKTLIVKYGSDDNYVANVTTAQFKVSKVDSVIGASSIDITVGKDESITVSAPSDATGRVLVTIGDVGYYGTIINGKAKIIIPGLSAGNYDVTVTYEGDSKYLVSSTTTSFTVSGGKQSTVSISAEDITEGEDANIVVDVPSDATGNVTIVIDGKTYVSEVKNGKAVFVVPGLASGKYTIKAYYSGDLKYAPSVSEGIIVVHKKETPDPHPHPHPHHNETHHGSAGAGVKLSDYPAGNQILVLLLMILAIGSTQLRRFRK